MKENVFSVDKTTLFQVQAERALAGAALTNKLPEWTTFGMIQLKACPTLKLKIARHQSEKK